MPLIAHLKSFSSRKNNISQHILCLLLSRFGPQRPSRFKYQVNNDPKQNLSSSLTSFNCCSPLPFFILLQLCYHFFSWLLIKNRFSPCRRLLEYDRISDGAHINGSGVSYRAECHPHKDDWPCYYQPLRVVWEQLWANERALTRASLIEVYVCKKVNVKQFWIITQKVLKTKSCIDAIMIQKLIHTRKIIIFMRWVGILIQSSDSILLNMFTKQIHSDLFTAACSPSCLSWGLWPHSHKM